MVLWLSTAAIHQITSADSLSSGLVHYSQFIESCGVQLTRLVSESFHGMCRAVASLMERPEPINPKLLTAGTLFLAALCYRVGALLIINSDISKCGDIFFAFGFPQRLRCGNAANFVPKISHF
jgi:hypothetical protein